MANQLYGYNTSSYGAASAAAAAAVAATPSLSSVYASRSLSDPYLPDRTALRYIGSDPLDQSSSKYSLSDYHRRFLLRTSSAASPTSSMYEGLRYSTTPNATSHLVSQASWSSADGAAADPLLAGMKRPSEG
ncbi:hypothetical protein SLA2020_412060 [Shorea laevis]